MKNYEKICQRFKFNQSHLFLRPIAPSLGKPSGSDVSKIRGRSVPPDDRTVDRFKPSHYSVAINDYDEDVLKNVKEWIIGECQSSTRTRLRTASSCPSLCQSRSHVHRTLVMFVKYVCEQIMWKKNFRVLVEKNWMLVKKIINIKI